MSFAKHAPLGADRKEKHLGVHSAERRPRTHCGPLITGAVSVFLAVIVWIAFGQALRHGFAGYDDDDYVQENPIVTNGLTLNGIQWAFTHAHAFNWHPLTTISHMLDCQVYGLQPWGHHLTNIVLQAAAAILLFLALRKLTDDPWPSLFVAAIFAIHPLRVESVAWVSERKDVLSGVFFMLVLLAYARYACGNGARFLQYIAVVVFFALGLMCKPTLVTVPFVLLLLDYWPLRRVEPSSSIDPDPMKDTWRRLIVEKLPLLVLSAASCAATLLAQKQSLATSIKPPLAERVSNALISYVVYMGQMIWPARLAVLYPYPEGNLKILQVIPALLVLLMISAVFFLWRKKYPFLLVGWLWYLGMLIPVIGIIQIGAQARADRYTYLPQIGLYLLVAWGVMELFHRWRRTREIVAITAVLIIMALTTRSYLQTSYWRDGETLWRHAIASTSNNYIAHNNLAEALTKSGRFAEAIAECEKALKIKPDFAVAHNNLGSALQENALRENEQSGDGARGQDGSIDEALEHYRKALQIRPDFLEASTNIGNALLQKGKMDEAIAQFQKILEMEPNYAQAEFCLGNAFFQKREVNKAIAHYQKAIRIKPNFAASHNNLGLALQENTRSGDGAGGQDWTIDEAIEHYRKALQIKPDSKEASTNLGDALLQKGKMDEAIAQFQKTLEMEPNYAQAEFSLGNALLQKREVNGAIAHYQKAVEIRPGYAEARYSLGNAFVAEGKYSDAIANYEAALRVRPDYFEAHHNLGCALATIGNAGKALEQFNEALRINGNAPEVHCALGGLLAGMGHREEAVAHLAEALRLKPDYEYAKQQLRELGMPVPPQSQP